ncbi:hypothetical protein C0J52_22437 [Blattella germanica]|nr:hypothetical protein C0J52_22437 [Blattella germanica]
MHSADIFLIKVHYVPSPSCYPQDSDQARRNPISQSVTPAPKIFTLGGRPTPTLI